MSISPEDYLSFLQKELVPLYFRVKEMNIKAENFDEQSRSYLAPFNEFRSTWDHMMKAAAMADEKDGKVNLQEAKVHLYRAGYDVYEIFASDLGLRITSLIEKYSSENIARVFPQYYTDYQPKIISVQLNLTDVRSKKNVDGNGNNVSFDIYEKNINELIEIYRSIQGYIPLLEKERKHKFKNLIKDNSVAILSTLVTGLIIGYLLFKLGLV